MSPFRFFCMAEQLWTTSFPNWSGVAIIGVIASSIPLTSGFLKDAGEYLSWPLDLVTQQLSCLSLHLLGRVRPRRRAPKRLVFIGRKATAVWDGRQRPYRRSSQGSGLAIPSAPAVWLSDAAEFVSPGLLDAERLQGFPQGWTEAAIQKPGGARARWRLLGNAVSVPVARWIGSRLTQTSAANHCDFPTTEGKTAQHNIASGGPGKARRLWTRFDRRPGAAHYCPAKRLWLERRAVAVEKGGIWIDL